MRQRKGFTLIELLVVISIIALLIGILLPALGAARQTARQMQSNTQVRGIHQGMVIYAQANKTGTSDGKFPGLTPNGHLLGGSTNQSNHLINEAIGTTFSDHGQDIGHSGGNHGGSGGVGNFYSGTHPGARVAIMLDQNLFSPEYAVNPLETSWEGTNPSGDADYTFDIVPWEPGEHYFDSAIDHSEMAVDDDDRLVGSHSYAMLALSDGHDSADWEARKLEWAETLNSQSVVISDRLLGGGSGGPTGSTYHSHTTREGSGQWRGSVGWNDGHVGTENRVDGFTTEYGGQTNEDDNIFDQNVPSGADDAGATACLWHHARLTNAAPYSRGGGDENCF